MENHLQERRGCVRRLRRLRRTPAIRNLVRETRVSPEDLVMPYFVIGGRNKKEPIKSMPGIYRLSIDNLVRDARGLNAVLLFGVKEKEVVPKAVRALRREFPDLVIFTDVCLCGYNPTGHCWVKDNDTTIKLLADMAVTHAGAGADFVSPSAMMDGQVGAIREALDKDGFVDTGIMAYSAKYASNFYGPFREAMDSAPRFGDRKDYQMDYGNSDEALREVEEDIEEGADIVMVKPALAYLDIIYRVKQRFNIPVAAFNVSGEYALVSGWLIANSLWQKNNRYKPSTINYQLILEVLTAIKRAGADIIITYYAKEFYSRRGK